MSYIRAYNERRTAQNNHNYLLFGLYGVTPSEMGRPFGHMLTVIQIATVSDVVYLDVVSILLWVHPLRKIKPVKMF
jgi:hypothetical protein